MAYSYETLMLQSNLIRDLSDFDCNIKQRSSRYRDKFFFEVLKFNIKNCSIGVRIGLHRNTDVDFFWSGNNLDDSFIYRYRIVIHYFICA